MRKRAVVLGSTGSIGRNALDVLDHLHDEWDVVGLAAGSRWRELAQQADRLRPRALALSDSEQSETLRSALQYSARIHTGPEALVQLLNDVECDCVICAVVGAQGLAATLRAVELGKRVALANKEALVIAGSILLTLADRTGARILPVDSEHSAIFQALQAGRHSEVRHVYLTASGGPFRTWSAEAMDEAGPEDALRHPTWKMGPKVTIDSATMMNKALEIVEARWLFDLRAEQIKVVVHPESIVHSFVEFQDGTWIGQLGSPDMRTPIQYALTYPARRECPAPTLDIFEARQLSFHRPDFERFPALELGYEAARRGGSAGAVLNGANEAAVQLFRRGLISFRDIARTTQRALQAHAFVASPSMEELLAADRWARHEVTRCSVC
jgi:1-deoxy-D-xylulose-5-phosphate reductoisomerase